MSKEFFSRYDAADGLKTEEDIAAFLETAAKDGASDPAFMARVLDVVAVARKRRGRPESWDGLLDAIKAGSVPDDFLNPCERSFSPDLQRYHHARMVKHARHARPSGCAWLRAAKRSLRDALTHSARGGARKVPGRGTSIFTPCLWQVEQGMGAISSL